MSPTNEEMPVLQGCFRGINRCISQCFQPAWFIPSLMWQMFVRKDALGPWRFFTIGPAWTRSIHSNHDIHGAGWKLWGVFFEHLNDSVLWTSPSFPKQNHIPSMRVLDIRSNTSLDRHWGLHHQSITLVGICYITCKHSVVSNIKNPTLLNMLVSCVCAAYLEITNLAPQVTYH